MPRVLDADSKFRARLLPRNGRGDKLHHGKTIGVFEEIKQLAS